MAEEPRLSNQMTEDDKEDVNSYIQMCPAQIIDGRQAKSSAHIPYYLSEEAYRAEISTHVFDQRPQG